MRRKRTGEKYENRREGREKERKGENRTDLDRTGEKNREQEKRAATVEEGGLVRGIMVF